MFDGGVYVFVQSFISTQDDHKVFLCYCGCCGGRSTCMYIVILSKEVWKILPSYEELRRGAIGRGKEVEVMSIRCHVN